MESLNQQFSYNFRKKINITLRRSFVFMSINRLDFKTNKDKFQGEIENIFFGFPI